jgi:hypothetical protein
MGTGHIIPASNEHVTVLYCSHREFIELHLAHNGEHAANEYALD